MTSVLLGLFDGLHTGHRAAIEALISRPGQKIVYTFDSLTLDVKGERGLLLTDAEKREGLLKAGADRVISKNFEEVKNLGPEEFVSEVLKKELGADAVICGENFKFGRGGRAGVEELSRLCRENKMTLIAVPLIYDSGEPVSTTRIRGLITDGKIKEANRLLGYRYGFGGSVEHGFKIGTRLGIKTINIEPQSGLALPKKGVYASVTRLCGRDIRGITNIGTRPTVHDGGETVIETHLFDFDGEVYGEKVRVELTEFIREEKRFGSASELGRAVAEDIQRVKELSKNE